jgi:hypothetical protein
MQPCITKIVYDFFVVVFFVVFAVVTVFLLVLYRMSIVPSFFKCLLAL